MAAHIVTALHEIASWKHFDAFDLISIRAALDIVSWTEELTLDEWRELSAIIDNTPSLITPNEAWRMIRAKATIWHRRYHSQWLELGQPSCREEWLTAKYPELQ